MKYFGKFLTAAGGRWVKGLIVISLALAAVPAIGGTAYATTITMGDLQQRCGEQDVSGGTLVVHSHLTWSYTTSDPNAGPATFWGMASPPDASAQQADATAEDCGISAYTSRVVSGWSILPDASIGIDGQVPNGTTSITYNMIADRDVTYSFDSSNPANSPPVLPGAGGAEIATGSPNTGPGPSPQYLPGCTFTGGASVSNGEVVAFSFDSSVCNVGTNRKGAYFTCTENGSSVGTSPSTFTSGQVVTWQIPAGADSCTLVFWGGKNVVNQLTPQSGYSIPWTPSGGFGTGQWGKLKSGVRPPLATPTGVHVTAGGNVTWNAVSGAAYYAIQRDGDPSTIQVVLASQSSFQDTVTDGLAHTYQVAVQPDLFPAQVASWSAAVTEPPIWQSPGGAAGALSWVPVAGHSGGLYNVKICPASGLCKAGHPAQTTLSSYVLPTSLTVGAQYRATVTSADSTGAAISDLSQPLTFTYQPAP